MKTPAKVNAIWSPPPTIAHPEHATHAGVGAIASVHLSRAHGGAAAPCCDDCAKPGVSPCFERAASGQRSPHTIHPSANMTPAVYAAPPLATSDPIAAFAPHLRNRPSAEDEPHVQEIVCGIDRPFNTPQARCVAEATAYANAHRPWPGRGGRVSEYNLHDGWPFVFVDYLASEQNRCWGAWWPETVDILGYLIAHATVQEELVYPADAAGSHEMRQHWGALPVGSWHDPGCYYRPNLRDFRNFRIAHTYTPEFGFWNVQLPAQLPCRPMTTDEAVVLCNLLFQAKFDATHNPPPRGVPPLPPGLSPTMYVARNHDWFALFISIFRTSLSADPMFARLRECITDAALLEYANRTRDAETGQFGAGLLSDCGVVKICCPT